MSDGIVDVASGPGFKRLQSDIAGLTTGMSKLARAVKLADESNTKYDKNVKAVTTTVKKLAENGDVITTTMIKQGRSWETLSVQVEKNKGKVNELRKAQDELRKSQEAQVKFNNASKIVNGLSAPLDVKSSLPELGNVEAAKAKLTKFIAENGIAGDKVVKIWADVERGKFLAQSESEKKLEQLLHNYSQAALKTGTEAANSIKQVTTESKRLAEQQDKLNKKNIYADLARSLKEATLKAKEFREEQEKQLKLSTFRNASRTVNGLSAPISVNTSHTEEASVERARQNLVKIVAATGISATRVAELWKLSANDVVRSDDIKEQKLIAALVRYRNEVRKTGTDAANSINKVRKAEDDAANGTDSMLISWQSFVRAGIFSAFYRSVYGTINLLKDGIRTSNEFIKRLTEIRTIDPSHAPFSQWSDELVKLSNSFGFDVLDQAEGAYQALSNQVVNSAGEFRIFGKAVNEFALASVTSVTAATQLLSGALKAYDLNVSQAEKVSAQLFETIVLGRVRAEEMADSFGQVAVIAAQLGVPLEELGAAIAATTVQGIKYSEVQTQLRGIFNSLLKPTEAMKEFFKSIGVESGVAAIKTFTFSGVLEKLKVHAHDDASELAELVRNIRGLTGAIGLTQTGFNIYQDDVGKIIKATEHFNDAVKISMESSRITIAKEVENIKNQFVTFGASIEEGVAKFNNAIVKISTVFQVLKDAVVTGFIVTAIAGFAKLLAIIGVFGTVAAGAFTVGPILAVAAAIGLVVGIVKALTPATERASTAFERMTKAWSTDLEERIKRETDARDNVIKNNFKIVDEESRVFRQRLAKEVAFHNERFKIVAKSNERIVADYKEVGKVITKQLNDIEAQIEASRTTAAKALENKESFAPASIDDLKLKIELEINEDSLDQQVKLLKAAIENDEIRLNNATKTEEIKFEFNLAKEHQQKLVDIQVDNVKKVFAHEKTESDKVFNQAKTKREEAFKLDAKNVDKLHTKRIDFAKAEENRKKSTRLQAEAVDLELAARQRMEAAQLKFHADLDKINNLNEINRLQGIQEGKLDDIAAKEIENQKKLFKEKQRITELDARRTRAIQVLEDVNKRVAKAGDIKDPEEIKRLQRDFQKAQTEVKVTSEDSGIPLDKERIAERQATEVALQVKLGDLEQTRVQKLKDATNKDISAKLEGLNKEIEAQRLGFKDVGKALLGPLATLEDFSHGAGVTFIKPFDLVKKSFNEIIVALNDPANKNLGKEVVNPAIEAVNKLDTVLLGIDAPQKLHDATKALRDALQSGDLGKIQEVFKNNLAIFGDIKVAQAKANNIEIPAAKTALELSQKKGTELRDQIKNLKIYQSLIEHGAKGVPNNPVQIINAPKVNPLDAGPPNPVFLAEQAKIAQQTAEEERRVREKLLPTLNATVNIFVDLQKEIANFGIALKKIQQEDFGPPDVRDFNIGPPDLRGFASGGMTDTRVIAATPGEIVVNREASSRWYSQLMGMNDRKSRSFSTNSNVDVGGINVSVSGSGSPDVTAAAVVDAINRGIRTGRLKLRS